MNKKIFGNIYRFDTSQYLLSIPVIAYLVAKHIRVSLLVSYLQPATPNSNDNCNKAKLNSKVREAIKFSLPNVPIM